MREGALTRVVRVGVPENLVGRFCVLAGLAGFAIAQPLLSILGDHPLVFLRTNVRGWTLVAFLVAVAAVPPVLVWALVALARRCSRPAGDLLYVVAIGVLAGLAAIHLAKGIGIDGSTMLAAVGVLAVVGVPTAYLRHRRVADWLRYTSVLPVFSVALFVFASPSGSILLFDRSSADTATDRSDLSPVVMVMLDELPTRTLLDDSDRIDASRFPHLAAFAEEATWYRRYTAMAPFTSASIPSIMSGRVPTASRPTFREHPDTLFSLLAATHDVRAVEAATWLCDLPSCHPEGSPDLDALTRTSMDIITERWSPSPSGEPALDEFAERVDATPDDHSLFAGSLALAQPERMGEFRRLVIESADGRSERPPFLYLHLMLPHQPWTLYPDGSAYRDVDNFASSVAPADREHGDRWAPWFARVAEQRHELQTMYSDALIGDLMATLRDTGLYDDSLVVVTADHGIAFRPLASAREPTLATIGDVAYVPLLIKEPDQRIGRVDDSNLMAIDVLPTVATILGVDPPWEVDGHTAGSPEITRRGDVKVWIDIVHAYRPRSNGSFEYSASESFGATATNLPSPIPMGQDVFDTWFAELGVAAYAGRPLDDFVSGEAGTVTILELDTLQHPPDPDRPPGHLTGRLSGVEAAGTAILILEVNGAIVSASRVEADQAGEQHVSLLIPPGVLADRNVVRAGLVTFLGDVEVAVR